VRESLQTALGYLADSDKTVRHIILLADGSDSEHQERVRELVEKEIVPQNITLSTVAIGAGPDLRFLEEIAELGNGRYHFTDQAANLPVIFARGLADDNLDDEKIEEIRAIWAGLEPKDLLTFLRKYAISTTFHNPTRVKYWSSIDRLLIISNLLTLNNRESYLGYYHPESALKNEGIEIFRPLYNVFGHQTGQEASDDPSIFKEAYNNSIDRYWSFTRSESQEDNWRKEWETVVPSGEDGTYQVRDVAEWLWNRFVADGLTNFGTLERAYVYSFLGSGRDFGYFVDPTDATRTYTEDDINVDPVLQERLQDLAISTVHLESDDPNKRNAAQYRVGLAVSFIVATPYVFAQEGI